MRCWLGLDTSIAAFGFCVMARNASGPFVLRAGTWFTKIDHSEGKLVDRARRVHDLGGKLLELVDEHQPAEAYVESLALGMKTSRGTAQTLGRMRGLVEGICQARGIELAEVRPDIVKQAVTGRRDASKDQVALMMSKLYGLRVGKGDTNATDAVAVAHVGAHRFGHGVEVTSGVVKYEPAEAEAEFDF